MQTTRVHLKPGEVLSIVVGGQTTLRLMQRGGWLLVADAPHSPVGVDYTGAAAREIEGALTRPQGRAA